MKEYKYKLGNTFILGSKIYLVVYSNDRQMFALSYEMKGVELSTPLIEKFDLQNKNDLRTLSTLNNQLPSSKYGQLGSTVLYDESEYIYMGNTVKLYGSLEFNKPLLVDLEKFYEMISEDIEFGSLSELESRASVSMIYQEPFKIPLESDKNLELIELAPPSSPLSTISKIQISSEGDAADMELIPRLSNTSDRYNPQPREYQIHGFGLNFYFNDLIQNKMIMLTHADQSGSNRNRGLTISYDMQRLSEGVGVSYVLSENEKLFPDWKLTTDAKYQIGDVIEKNGNQIIYSKILRAPVKKTTFGYINDVYNEGSVVLIHPEVYLGGNKEFNINKEDEFLLIGKPIVGTKSRGFNSVFDKTIGSTQFPVKKRKQLDKMVLVKKEFFENKQIEAGLSEPNNYYPPSFIPNVPNLKTKYTDEEIKNNLTKLSWEKYRLLETGNLSDAEIEKQLLDYFDYQSLSIIEQKNPSLYDSLIDLMGESINIYLKNLPKSKKQTQNVIEIYGLVPKIYLNYYNNQRLNAYNFNERDGKLRIEESEDIPAVKKLYEELSIYFNNSFSGSYIYLTKENYFETQNILSKFIENQLQTFLNEDTSAIISRKRYLKEISTDFYIDNFVSNYFNSLINSQIRVEKMYLSIDAFYDGFDIEMEHLGFDLNWSLKVQDSRGIIINSRDNEEYPIVVEKIKNALIPILILLETYRDEIKKIQYLVPLIDLLKYYDTVSDVSEVSIEDVVHDYRFKYLMKIFQVYGFPTDSDFESIVDMVVDLKGNLNNAKIKLEELGTLKGGVFIKTQFFNTIQDDETEDDNILEPLNVGNVFSAKNIKDIIRERVNYFRQVPLLNDLLTEKITPSEVWLGYFGLNFDETEEEEEMEVESQTEPTVVVEEVEDVNTEEINWDEIDPDEVDIALDDDEILEENIDV